MRLLFLCKRHPQQRDLIERPYGRFFHLPACLAALGHEVHVALISHRKLPSLEVQRHGATWYSHDVLPMPGAAFRRLQSLACALKPDWVIGLSDTYFGILAARLGRKFGLRVGIDAYDNFESYLAWCSPLHWAWRAALREVQLVTAAGPQLAALLGRGRRGVPAQVLPMAADPAFQPRDRLECRRKLGLPVDGRYLGYSGSFDRRRRSHVLLDALEILRRQRPETRLLLTGRHPEWLGTLEGVRSLGYLPDEQLPLFVNSLDVACVTVAGNAFGNYSYPAKLYEAMACEVPVVASDTAPVRWILNGAEPHLCPPGDAPRMAEKILLNLPRDRVQYAPHPGWDPVAKEYEGLLLRMA